MRRSVAIVGLLALLLAACGGSDDGTPATEPAANGGGSSSDTSANDDGASSNVVDPQPPGQASASVDGEEYTFDTVGPVGCEITSSEFNIGFLAGDNEVSFVAGGTASGSEWRGRIDLNVQSADGIANYFADFSGGSGGTVAVDGASMSYSGPWQVLQPGASEAEPAGNGSLSVTCG